MIQLPWKSSSQISSSFISFGLAFFAANHVFLNVFFLRSVLIPHQRILSANLYLEPWFPTALWFIWTYGVPLDVVDNCCTVLFPVIPAPVSIRE